MKVSRQFPGMFPYTPESFPFFLYNVARAETETFMALAFIYKGEIVSCIGNFGVKVSTLGNNLFPDCFLECFQRGTL